MLKIPECEVSIPQVISWVLIIVLIIVVVLFWMNLRIFEKSAMIEKHDKAIVNIVNYLNNQAQPQELQVPQPPKEVKKDGK